MKDEQDESLELDEPDHGGGHPAWWMALTPEERVLHYNRNLPKECPHKASLSNWPKELRKAYSFDPYFNTPHSMPHSVELFFKGQCECQTCTGKFGIPRENDSRTVNLTALREKLAKL